MQVKGPIKIRVMTGIMTCTLAVIGQQSRRPPLAAAARALAARSQDEQGKASLQLSSTQHHAPVVVHPRCTMASCDYVCNLSPRGWTEDRAVGPAQFVCFLPADSTASSNPFPRQPTNNKHQWQQIVRAPETPWRVDPAIDYRVCGTSTPPYVPSAACGQGCVAKG